jgi:hypothetical protein
VADRVVLVALLAVACRREDDPDAPDAPADSDEPAWIELAATCAAPDPLPADPITPVGRLQLTQDEPGEYFVELLDLEPDGDRLYAVGQGGLIVYDTANPAAPAHLGHFPERNGRYHRLELLGDGIVAASHRDRGVEILDASDPAAIAPIAFLPGEGREGLLAIDDLLLVTSRTEGLLVFDVADPARPELVTAVPGLASPWEISRADGGRGWIADNTLGLVPADLSDPRAPRLGEPFDVGGAAQHVEAEGGWAYAAIGAGGVAVVDVADPAAPVVVSTLPVSGSAVMTDVRDGLLVTVDHEGLQAWDVSDPRAPVPIGRQRTEQFALAVALDAEVAWAGDWSVLSSWDVDPDAISGDLDLVREIRVPEQGGAVEVPLANHGGGAVTLAGATVDDPRLSLVASGSTVDPAGALQLSFASDGQPLDATLCLASDDADEPVREIRVVSGVVEPPIGEPAPDFALTDLDGNTHRLSEQLGKPVLIAYFATW